MIEKSRTSVNFLETTVSLESDHLEMSLYVKPTDHNNYLLFDSTHLYHCKKSITYGQFLRIRRICSKQQEVKHNCPVKAAQLRQKSYPQTLIREAYARVRNKSRVVDVQEKNASEDEQKIYRTTTYNLEYNGLRTQVCFFKDLGPSQPVKWHAAHTQYFDVKKRAFLRNYMHDFCRFYEKFLFVNHPRNNR